MLNSTFRHNLRQVKQFQGRTYLGNDHVGIYMLQALIPFSRREKTRFQVAIEVERHTNNWIRPVAARAASGHRNWSLLDPTRIAGIATTDLLRTLPGLFHMTSLSNITTIIRSGLKPGCMLTRRGRVDTHFAPFPPHDHRNGLMEKKLQQIRKSGESFAGVSVAPIKCDARTCR